MELIVETLGQMTPQIDTEDYKARVREVEKLLNLLGLKVVGMDVDLGTVKEGVSNFREFQRKSLEWMGWFKAHEERREEKEQEDKEAREKRDAADRKELEDENKRRARIHYWWLAILSGIIVGAVLGVGTWVFNFFATHHISQNNVTSNTMQDAKLP